MSNVQPMRKNGPATRAAVAAAVPAATAAAAAAAAAGAGAESSPAAAAPAKGSRPASAAAAARPERQQQQQAEPQQQQAQEQALGQEQAQGEVGEVEEQEEEQGGEKEKRQQQGEEREHEQADGQGPEAGREPEVQEEQWQQQEEKLAEQQERLAEQQAKLAEQLKQLREKKARAQRGGAGQPEQASAPEGEAQQKAEEAERMAAERMAAEQREGWRQAGQRLQRAREESRQQWEQPRRGQEAFAIDPTPPPSPPPPSSSSDSGSRGDSDGDSDAAGRAAGPHARAPWHAQAAAAAAPHLGSSSRSLLEKVMVQPAKFSGEGASSLAVAAWLRSVRDYLDVTATRADTGKRRLYFATTLLEGEARIWWESRPEPETITTFEDFSEEVKEYFAPVSAKDDALEAALRVKQREGQTVQQYYVALRAALQPLSELECSTYVRTGLFINGLRYAIRDRLLEVPGIKNRPLMEVVRQAAAREGALASARHAGAGRGYGYPPHAATAATSVGLRAMGTSTADGAHASQREPRRDASRERAPTAADGQLREDLEGIKATLSAMQSRWNSNSPGWSGGARGRPGGAGGPAPPSSRTAAAESDRDERYRKGLCFVCGSAGHRARFCPSKQNAGEEGRSNRRSARYPTQQEN